MTNDNSDPLDALLTLEDSYYDNGYQSGLADGIRSGRLEGRLFGLEKGFQKYLTLGKIRGRTIVWTARQSNNAPEQYRISNTRHGKHLEVLRELVENPPIKNEEEDVDEVEDRIRRGKAKVRILTLGLSEQALEEGVAGMSGQKDGEIEDMKVPKMKP